MMRKTALAIAVAGACAWPMAAFAWSHGQHARTPMSDNETGSQHMGFVHRGYDRDAALDEGRYEVQTPLSVSETAPMVEWNSYHGWSHPAPDRVRYSYYVPRTAVGATRGESDTYYLVPERTQTDYAIVPAR